MNLDELKVFVGETLVNNTNVPQFIIAKPNAPRPAGNYGSIDNSNLRLVSWNFREYSNSVLDVDLKTTNLYYVSIDVEIFRGEARDQELVFASSLTTEAVRQNWAENNVGLILRSPILDVSQVQDASIEERAIITLEIMFEHSVDEPLVSVETVCISGVVDDGQKILDTINIGQFEALLLQRLQPSDVQTGDLSNTDLAVSSDSSVLVTGSPSADLGTLGNSYITKAVSYGDGNYYSGRNADLDGNANSTKFLVSAWFNASSSNTGTATILANRLVNGIIELNGSDLKIILLGTSSGTLDVSTNIAFFDDQWHHVLCSADVLTGQFELFVDDVQHFQGGGLNVIGDFFYSIPDHGVGANVIFNNSNNNFVGGVADLYANYAERLDLTVEANRRKFITSDLKPVDLGVIGELPTGNQPIIFLVGDKDNFETNKGYGGDFTVGDDVTTGNLLDFSTSPSDGVPPQVVDAGSAYAYAYSKVSGLFSSEQKLTASDGLPGDFFGSRVYVSGDGLTIAVGAPDQSTDVISGGAVYIFKLVATTWTQVQRVIPSVLPNTLDAFGEDLCLSDDGNTLVVSSPGEDLLGTDQGAVYVFEWNGIAFIQSAKLQLSTPVDEDFLGRSVYLSKDSSTLFMGVVKADSSGVVAVKDKSLGWVDGTEDYLITPLDSQPGDFFGASFGSPLSSSSDGNILVASSSGKLVSSGRGKVYQFLRTTGQHVEQAVTLIPHDGVSLNLFGYSLSVSDDARILVVSAQSETNPGSSNVGKSFMYSRVNGEYVLFKDIVPTIDTLGSFFGYRVFVSSLGNQVFIGDYDYANNAPDEGMGFYYSLPDC